jgi:hypothetical protein
MENVRKVPALSRKDVVIEDHRQGRVPSPAACRRDVKPRLERQRSSGPESIDRLPSESDFVELPIKRFLRARRCRGSARCPLDAINLRTPLTC